jgi:heat shock protein 5
LDAASWYGYDVLSFGIETDDGKMTRLIPRNPTVPMKKTHVLTTFWDKRSTVTIKVFEGERSETKHCKFLGQIELSGIPPARVRPRAPSRIYARLLLGTHVIMHFDQFF